MSLPETTRTFAGIPVRSDRVCVLVDLSGSIHTKMKGDVSRHDYVILELERLLMALPESAMFNVIGFADGDRVCRGCRVKPPNRVIGCIGGCQLVNCDPTCCIAGDIPHVALHEQVTAPR